MARPNRRGLVKVKPQPAADGGTLQTMSIPHEEAIEWVRDYCDLSTRLRDIPPSAQVRGLYMVGMEHTVRLHHRLDEYHAWFGPRTFSPLRYYDATEYVIRAAVAAALLSGRAAIDEGLEELGRGNTRAIRDSLLGTVLLRLLSPDPRLLLRQGIASQRQSCTYARWTLEFPSTRSAIMHFEGEYAWIESLLVGAAKGSFELIDLPVHISVRLHDRYRGEHHLSW